MLLGKINEIYAQIGEELRGQFLLTFVPSGDAQ